MYLIGHAALGMTLASKVTNPILAFGIGWLSHYLGDFFPHGDEQVGKWAKKGNEVQRILAIVAIDGVIILIAYGFFIRAHGFTLAPLGFLQRFHECNHNFFKINLPLWAGFVAQGVVTISLWWYLISV